MSCDQQEYDLSFMDDFLSTDHQNFDTSVTAKDLKHTSALDNIMDPLLGNAAGTPSTWHTAIDNFN
jgi:hypothetical protein